VLACGVDTIISTVLLFFSSSHFVRSSRDSAGHWCWVTPSRALRYSWDPPDAGSSGVAAREKELAEDGSGQT
jgi:hypothetical protein